MEIIAAAACVPDSKGNRDANLQAALGLIKRLAAEGAQLIVLPEACLHGYAIADAAFDRQHLRGIAEPLDGEYAKAFRAAARESGVFLVASYDRRAGSDIYNTAELISPDGKTVGLYDKTCVVGALEKDYYRAGAGPAVFETELGRIGILICVDRTVHENWRLLMLQEAELVVIPANGGYGEDNTRRLQTMALDNAMGCVFAHPRRGMIIDAEGRIADYDRDPMRPWALASIDLSRIASRQADIRARRRPELYGPLAEPG